MFYFNIKLIHVITTTTLLDNNITTLSTQNTLPKTCNRSAPRITFVPNFPTFQKPVPNTSTKMEGEERRVLSNLWRQIAESEARILLLGDLIKIGVGLAELETLGDNINSKFKSFHYKDKVAQGKVVLEDQIRSIMTLKLKDEKKHYGELLKERNMKRKSIGEKLKTNSRPYRNLMKELRGEAARTKIELTRKNSKKVEHLKMKYRENTEDKSRRIPEDMEEHRNLRVFSPTKYNEIKEEEYEIKIIGDIEVSEKEKNVVKLLKHDK